MPVVSVIIPTHNRVKLLREAVESVLAQTYSDWEAIVVDDGSTDTTNRLLSQYGQLDRRIHWVRQDHLGASAARNHGIRMATGELIAFLDDDDLWFPEKLQRQVELMQRRADLGLTYTKILVEGTRRVLPTACGTTFRELVQKNFIPTATVMVRRRCLDRVGWFDPRFRISQDFELWLRIVRHYPIEYLNQPLALYRKQPGGLVSRSSAVFSDHLAVLKTVTPAPQLGVTARFKRRQLAVTHYRIARALLEEKRFRHAARHFLSAALYHPGVGAEMRWPGQRGLRLTMRYVNPFLAIPYCLIKEARHAHR